LREKKKSLSGSGAFFFSFSGFSLPFSHEFTVVKNADLRVLRQEHQHELVSAETGRVLQVLEKAPYVADLGPIRMSSDGRWIITGNYKSVMRIRDARSGRCFYGNGVNAHYPQIG
jgi:hypothetical protein